MAAKDVRPLVKSLNLLLANTVHMYHEAQGFHWNVKGPDFAQYHELFANIYGYFYDQIDPTAENILKLGYDSPFHMSDFVKMKTINDAVSQDTPADMTMELLAGLNSFIGILNNVFSVATDLEEQGVADYIAGQIDAGNKWAWQLRASVNMQKPNKLF